jgi:hypothetical protein
MRNTIKTTLVVVTTAWVCLGCNSLNIWKEKDLTPNLPLGVIVVASNANIYWEDEDPSTGVQPGKKDTPEKTKTSSANELINDAEAILQQSFIDAGISALVSKDQITESQAYGNARLNRAWNNKSTVLADDYRPVNYRDKDFAAALAKETGVQGGIYILFDFSKVMASGIGKSGHFRVQVNMQVTIVDSEGRIQYRKSRPITSEDRIPVSFRSYNQEEMMDVFRTVIANSCYLFIQEFAVVNGLDLKD